MSAIRVVQSPLSRSELQQIAEDLFGDLVKAVVDIQRGVIAVGAELHSDEEAVLLQDGSRQEDLWGINIYPSLSGEEMIEFDSMINVRPRQGNRSRSVENPKIRASIGDVVRNLVKD